MKRDKSGKKHNWEHHKDLELTEDLEAHILQGQKLLPLTVKDWQAAKNGSKSHACKFSSSTKRLFLKPK